jgi:hypothetical protein
MNWSVISPSGRSACVVGADQDLDGHRRDHRDHNQGEQGQPQDLEVLIERRLEATLSPANANG